MSSADTRVRFLAHADKRNHGAGASRNLGLLSATSDFIAFLDADDRYLPSRFAVTREIFSSTPDAEGVYETVGTQYADASFIPLHRDRVPQEDTGLSKAVSPERLFRALATGRFGHIHLNGLVIRRRILDGKINFDESLRQCQDSDWMLRLAAFYNLYPGRPGHPVAVRRVHEENRVFNTPEALHYRRKYLRKCMLNDFYGSTDTYAKLYIVARYVSWLENGILRRLGKISQPAIIMASGLYLLFHPRLLFQLFK
jgi:glycosyltransferase involved in cell wall biosynthesis